MRIRVPLKIVWPRILVLPIGTKRTNISGRIMDQAMPDHFVLPLETLSSFASSGSPSRGNNVAVLKNERSRGSSGGIASGRPARCSPETCIYSNRQDGLGHRCSSCQKPSGASSSDLGPGRFS